MTYHHQVINFSKIKSFCRNCSAAELCLPLGLHNSDISLLENAVKSRCPLQRGDYLYQIGDHCHSLYAVHSGSVRSFIISNEGDEQVLGFHLPGELLGFDGFESDHYKSTAIALETTKVCELPIKKLDELCQNLPGLQKQLQRLIGKEIAADHEMLLLLGKKNAEARLASFLLNLSSRLNKHSMPEPQPEPQPELNLTMSRQDIGNYLGLAVETVSRLFTHFQDEKLISINRKNLLIQNPERLRHISGEGKTTSSSSSLG